MSPGCPPLVLFPAQSVTLAKNADTSLLSKCYVLLIESEANETLFQRLTKLLVVNKDPSQMKDLQCDELLISQQ